MIASNALINLLLVTALGLARASPLWILVESSCIISGTGYRALGRTFEEADLSVGPTGSRIFLIKYYIMAEGGQARRKDRQSVAG